MIDERNIDRLPPHAFDAERAFLGGVLWEPVRALPEAIGLLGTNAEVFYDLRHATIWKRLLTFQDRPLDVVTLAQEMRDAQELAGCGGPAVFGQLMEECASRANLPEYARIIMEKWRLRRILRACAEITVQIQDKEGYTDAGELIESLEQSFLQNSREMQVEDQWGVKESVHRAIEYWEAVWKRDGSASIGIPTGFVDFDKMTQGLKPGDMIVIAARPSVGKTSLAMNFAEHICLNLDKAVGIFSLEMTKDALIRRAICTRAKVNERSIMDGFLAERDFPKLASAAGRFVKARLFIEEQGGLNMLKIRATARRMHQKHRLDLIIVDYLQLVSSTKTSHRDNRNQEITEISGGLKAMAKELKVPVVVLSQLNRDIEKDKNRKPRLSDLRDGGAIEQDADLVCLLYRADDDEGGQEDQEIDRIKMFIGKQRNGPIGTVELTFLKAFTRFESAAKYAGEPVETNFRKDPYPD